MKAIINVLGVALVARIAYGIGASEGNNAKEKASSFGLKVVAKFNEIKNKILPKEEPVVEEPAPAEEA